MTPNTPVIILVTSLTIILISVITINFELTNISQEAQNKKLDLMEKNILQIEHTLNMTTNEITTVSFGHAVVKCDKTGCYQIVNPHWTKTEKVCNNDYCGILTFDTNATKFEDVLNP